ncbi:cytidine deaminase [Zooshikella harenae]|uniref:Cytidine deaminase n=1 Tax=Zooshikella harenae TaxID=2827238 RepID=A0ABS5ZFP9_9GAMM|nr:cytidine deaminase [Zooshikella harenae]MBU2712883.1 cytidine deaminase [Zooshikella harenae]
MNEISHDTLMAMKAAAKQAAANAYCIYSDFPVGAALLTKAGQIIPGCNVENISFGLTNCAERTAIFSAVAQGLKKEDLVGLLIYMPGNKLYSPCGACRQVMAEFLSESAPVYAACDKEETTLWQMNELLPASFNF